MPIAVFYEVVVPLLEVKGTSCTMISSPVDKYNFYSRLINLKDDEGEHLFYVYHLDLQCDVCKAINYRDCPHSEDKIPPWKSKHRHDIVEHIYKDYDETRFDQESRGLITGSGGGAFHEKDIDAFEKRALFNPNPSFRNRRPQYIVSFCDPNGSGGSQSAITSMVRYDSKYVIVGMDSHNTRGVETPLKDLVVAHLRAILRHPYLTGIPIIFVPECNLANAAVYMYEHSAIDQLVHIPFMNDPAIPGFRNDDKTKAEGGDLLKDQLECGNVYWMEGWVCANPFMRDKTEEQRRTITLDKFYKELGTAVKVFLDPTGPFGSTRYTYSAKCGPPPDYRHIPGQNDDKFVTLITVMLLLKIFMSRRFRVVSDLVDTAAGA